MTRTEFKEIGLSVFYELLPKTKASDVQDVLNTLFAELQDQGLDLEDDEDEDEVVDELMDD